MKRIDNFELYYIYGGFPSIRYNNRLILVIYRLELSAFDRIVDGVDII